MAWTDQCKYAFKQTATFLYTKADGQKKITRVLKELSAESGIPYKTLYHWWNEARSLKNQTNGQEVEDIDKSAESISSLIVHDLGNRSKCLRCGNGPVKTYKDARGNQRLYGEKSKYHGLCSQCIKRQSVIENIDKDATRENGDIMVVCPMCNHVHYINKDRFAKKGRMI